MPNVDFNFDDNHIDEIELKGGMDTIRKGFKNVASMGSMDEMKADLVEIATLGGLKDIKRALESGAENAENMNSMNIACR